RVRSGRVLVPAAGGLSVFSTNALVDLVGLKTPSSIAEHQRWTLPSCGRERGKAVAAIAQSSGAGYFVVALDWDYTFAFTTQLRVEGFQLQSLRTRPGGPYAYSVYRLTLPPGTTTGK